jgi:Type II CAAX prenyl endopeptidase Rce1-like
MHSAAPSRRADAGWLMLLGSASLGVAWLAHRHLGLSLQPQGWVHWVAFLLVGPWVEEWALRRQLLPECARWLHHRWPRRAPWVANGLVSLVFVALHHGMAGSMAWLWFIPSWVLGMVWFRFQRLSVCALVHTWFNVSLLVVSSLGVAHAGTLPASSTPSKGAHMPDCTQGPEAGHASLHTESPALVTVRQADAGMIRLAMVQAAPPTSPGEPRTWTLVVQTQAESANHPARCWRNTALLGTPDTAPLPTMQFEHGLLSITWRRPGSAQPDGPAGEQAFREMHRMVFDTDRPQAPLVRYEHQVTTLREVRGVRADLVRHTAQWHRRPADASETSQIVGELQALPLIGLQALPEHTAYSLQPKVNRVYRSGTP